jgi:hypothetical protein
MRLPNSAVHIALDAIGVNGPNRQVGISLTPITVTPEGLTNVTEPTAPSYDRATLLASDWSPAADRAATATATFGDAAEDWGIAVEIFITDGAGVPEIPFDVEGGGFGITAGMTGLYFPIRLPAPL